MGSGRGRRRARCTSRAAMGSGSSAANLSALSLSTRASSARQLLGPAGPGEAQRQRSPQLLLVVDEALQHLPVAPGQQPDGDVQAVLLLRRRAVTGPRREVQDITRVQRQLPQAVDPPGLLAFDLQHQHLVGVGVVAQTVRSGRAEVGVGLDSMAGRLLELAGEALQRRPQLLEPLQHDRRTVRGEADDAGEIRSVLDHARAEADRAGHVRRRQRRPVAHQPERRPAKRGTEQLLDGIDGQQVGERSALPPDLGSPAPDVVPERLDIGDAARQGVQLVVHLGIVAGAEDCQTSRVGMGAP